jgi:5'-nucleotidase/UDP-sugar diphosphatase
MKFAKLISGLAAVLAVGWSAAFADPATIKIVHFNDLDRMSSDNGRGGVAKLATVVKQVRAEGGTVLVTNGGDAISPSLLSSFDKGEHIIELFNQIGLTAMAVGNREFDFGPGVLQQRIAQAKFPMLSNNALDPDGSLVDGVKDYILIEVGGYTVGLFGLTTVTTKDKSQPGPVTFADAVETARAMDTKLREAGAHFVIALSHTYLDEDTDLLTAGVTDLVLSGDDHLLQLLELGGTVLVESGAQAEYVTVITVTLDTVEGRRGPKIVSNYDFEVINTASIAEDPVLAKSVAAYEARLSKELDIQVGTTTTVLDTRRATVRGGEAAFANLLTDAMRAATGADVALTNGGGIRADRVYEPGTVLSRRDVLSELPFGNKTILIEVSGTDLLAALEIGVGDVEKTSGRFAHVSGMTYSYDPSKPVGSRIVGVTVGGKALDADAVYKLATNDFMGKGGDGYRMFARARRIIDANAGGLMASQVMDYITAAGSVGPKVEGRITQIGG